MSSTTRLGTREPYKPRSFKTFASYAGLRQDRLKHLTLLALGSRGDVQPLVALGLQLVAGGHLVRVVAAADYEPLVAAYGLPFAPAGGSIRDVLRPDAVYDAFDSAANPLGFGLRFLREIDPLVTRILADCAAAAADADALIVTTLGQFVGDTLAEQLGIPCHVVHMHPRSVTRAWPSMFFPSLPDWAPAHGAYNRLTHHVGEHGFWQLLHGPLERARAPSSAPRRAGGSRAHGASIGATGASCTPTARMWRHRRRTGATKWW